LESAGEIFYGKSDVGKESEKGRSRNEELTQGNNNSPWETAFAQVCWNYPSSSSSTLTLEATSTWGNCHNQANGNIAGVRTADTVPNIDFVLTFLDRKYLETVVGCLGFFTNSYP